jgi:hypothetical protein
MKTAKRITNVLAVVVSAMMLGVGSVHAASLGSSTFTSFDTAGQDIDVTGSDVVDWGYYDDQGDFNADQTIDNSKAVSGIGTVSVVKGDIGAATGGNPYNPNLTMTFDDGAGPTAGTVAIGSGFGAWAAGEDNAATFTFNNLDVGTHTVRVYVGHGANDRVFDMDYAVTASDGNLSGNTATSALGSGDLHATYELVFSTTDASADLELIFNSTSGGAGSGWIGGYVVETTAPPIIDPALSPKTVDENVAADTLVGTLSMLETSGNFTYSLPGGVLDNNKFKLDGAINSNVLTDAVFDFETKDSYDIRVVATEDGGGGQVLTNEVTISVNDINDAPTAANKTVTTAEDTSYVFSTNDFNFADEDATESNTFVQVQVTTLETAGALEYYNVSWGDVTADQEISAADIDAGNLRFVPATNAYGTAYDTFEFKVHDGDVYSAAAYTMEVDVTQANDDAPILIVSAEVGVDDTAVAILDSVSEGSGLAYTISGGANQGLFDLTGGVLTKSVAPVADDVDDVYWVEVRAADSLGSTKVLIKVTVVSGAPTATIFMFQ